MQTPRRRILVGAVVLVLVTALATYSLTAFALTGQPIPFGRGLRAPTAPRPGAPDGAAQGLDLDKLKLIYGELKANYVDAEKLDDRKLLDGAIDGMVKVLDDPYTVYMDRDKYQSLMSHFEEKFSGIGVRVEMDKDGHVTVVAPIKGTPGERAGLVAGDVIVSVDDRDVSGLSLDEVVKLIRGPKGTTVKLTVARSGSQETLVFSIVRADITQPTVEARMLEPGIGYVRIMEFNERVGEHVRDQVKQLQKQGMRGLVLDLRQDPGGLLSEAVNVAKLFVPRGPIVSVVSRTGKKQTYESDSRGFNLPLVVLVDGFSASASEIVAGAIQDRATGVLIGSKTFGKGSVQSLVTLPDGGGLKLTTAKYLTPSGRSINGVGITPDVTVEPPGAKDAHPVDLDAPGNPQLQKAVEVLKAKLQ